MYGKFKIAISRGDYDLADMKRRIALAWAGGEITTEQRTELEHLAEQGAKPENSFSSVEARLAQVFNRLSELEERVSVLEGRPSTDVDAPDSFPAWAQPTGAHDAYRNGSRMTYTDGKRYVCVAPEGVAVVWGPDVMPSYWQVAA